MPTPTLDHSAKPGSFAAFLVARGIHSWKALQEKFGTTRGYSVAVSLHHAPNRVHPNSPMLEMIAKVLNVSLGDVQAFAKGKPMSAPQEQKERTKLERGTHRNKVTKPGPKPGKQSSWQKRARELREKRGGPITADTVPQGTRLVHVKKPKHALALNGKRRTYNTLKKQQVALREAARALISTFNIRVAEGQSHMPPLPLSDLYLVLTDYLETRGERRPILLHPDYLKAFDD